VTKLSTGSAIGQEGSGAPDMTCSSARNVAGEPKANAAIATLKSQIPMLPSRRREAGDFRCLRGRTNSASPTISKLPTITAIASRGISALRLTAPGTPAGNNSLPASDVQKILNLPFRTSREERKGDFQTRQHTNLSCHIPAGHTIEIDGASGADRNISLSWPIA